MASKRVLVPVEVQLEQFHNEFEIYKKYKDQLADPNWEVRMKAGREAQKEGWKGGKWNWDEAWDGRLVQMITSLAQVGFTIHRFYRKRKIDMAAPKGMKRPEIVELLCDMVGSDWFGISFRQNGMSVWWKGGGPWKSYRG